MHHARAIVAAKLQRPAMHHAAHHQLAAVERGRVCFEDNFTGLGFGYRHIAVFKFGGGMVGNDPAGFHGVLQCMFKSVFVLELIENKREPNA